MTVNKYKKAIEDIRNYLLDLIEFGEDLEPIEEIVEKVLSSGSEYDVKSVRRCKKCDYYQDKWYEEKYKVKLKQKENTFLKTKISYLERGRVKSGLTIPNYKKMSVESFKQTKGRKASNWKKSQRKNKK